MTAMFACRAAAVFKALTAVTASRGAHGRPKIYDHYFGYFRETDLYRRTTARSDPELRRFVLSSGARLDASALSVPELVEAALCCEDTSFGRHHGRKIEDECCRRARHLPPLTSVTLMDAWASSLGGKGYLREVVPHWTRYACSAETFDFVHLVYLASLGKGAPESFLHAVADRLRTVLPECALREVGILCSSLFKLKLRVADDAVLAAVARSAAGGLRSRGDRFDVVSALKFLRSCEYYDAKLLAEIAAYVREEGGELAVAECAHFLAAFSSVAAYDEPTFRRLERRVADLLRDPRSTRDGHRAHPAESPRVKDVAKVLWALAHVGHDADNWILETAEEFLERRSAPSDVFHVLDALQSFVCLDFYPRRLIEEMLSADVRHTIVSSHLRKPSKQLAFVRMSASVMLGDTLKGGPPLEDPPSSRTDRAQYERDCFRDLADLFAARGLPVSCALPHIHVAGVTFTVCPSSLTTRPVLDFRDLKGGSKQLNLSRDLIDAVSGTRKQRPDGGGSARASARSTFVSVELLDGGVLVRGSESTMRGIMKAKVVQLRRLGIKVVFATPGQVKAVSKLSGVDRDDWWVRFVKRCASDTDPQFYRSVDGADAVVVT